MHSATLSADGTDGSGHGGAGGSGGSILIYSNLFEGNGRISTDGGDGSANFIRDGVGTGATYYLGGGGSGGRIAIHSTANTFNGTITSFGGNNGIEGPRDKGAGGPGTIFFNTNGYKKLVLDNNKEGIQEEIKNLDSVLGSVAWLTDDDGTTSFEFDEVVIQNRASLAIKLSNLPGDNVSLLYI